ncbi:MAG: DegV family protein [Clostridia bacterium]|nr:DegV family protein [Clostridia bacterium]
MLADLHYLARGGRIGRAAAWAGSVIRIHPIVGVRDGVVAPVERVRTRRRALEVMAERLAVAARTWTGPVGIALMHTGEEDEAGTLRELVTARLEKAPAEAWTTTFPPVLGAHTGPGLVGAAIWPIPSDLA